MSNGLGFGGGSGMQMEKGIYINVGKIIGVRDVSGQKPNDFAEKPCEIGIQIKLDIGQSFEPIMSFAGAFKRNEAGAITDWGNATTVKIFLSNMGIKGNLDANNRIPADVLKSLVGREIVRLSYVKGKKTDGSGKPAYGTWNTVLPAGDGAEKQLLDLFKKSLKKGYPKNFHPEILDEEEGSGAPESGGTDGGTERPEW